MRDDKRVHAGHGRQQDTSVFRQLESEEGSIEYFLVRLAIELQPGEIPEHQCVALVSPDVPGWPEGTIDRDHHDRQAIIAGNHDVLRHVGETVCGTGRERSCAVCRSPDGHRHGAVFAFYRYDVPFAEWEPGHTLNDFCLWSYRIDAARDATGSAVCFTSGAQCVTGGVVSGDDL